MTREHSERLNGLDHLRALAIVLVLLFHYRAFKHPEWVDTIGRFGWTGVDLFFVLSGFLISGQLFQEMNSKGTISLKTFYIKRFFRIIPAYLFTLFLYFTIPFFREREALPPVWKFITFTQNYGLDVIDQGTFSHAWSLCIEEQFYLILPLFLVMIVPSRLFKYFAVLIILFITFSLIMRLIIWNEAIAGIDNTSVEFWRSWYMKIYYPTHTRLDGLGTGVLISYCMQYFSGFKKRVHENGNKILLAGLILQGISFWICNEQASKGASVFGFTLVAISYGCIVLSAVSESSFLSKWKSDITAELAALSYAVYLSHKGIIHMIQALFEQFNIDASNTGCLIICLLGCIAGGLGYRLIIEKPFAHIKDNILKLRKF
ncbi:MULTISPECIES: acyltransferase family protein [unclassified Chryseobacterium]|uniref:acyltransferase family protein n=1 Tax=unclassified Chryseobacterium TaxID=2593645 RepID=UPI00100C148F|nr:MULTISPECIES: acyltransferase [unclassified Chryseobacterium]RXM51808.1 acyltransferase [Chryseobacterium sp. CH25]RXM67384.1 acyltransferase [Chryseobacterium sp. CH1]